MQECDGWREVKTLSGRVVSNTCIHWADRPAGYDADPRIYEGRQAAWKAWVSTGFSGDMLRNLAVFLNDFAKGQLQGQAAASSFDIERLIETNTCNSPGILRFQENMRRYALKEELLALEGPAEPLASGRD